MSVFEIVWEIKNLETWETRPENGFHEAGSKAHIEQRFYELVQPWEAYKNSMKQTKNENLNWKKWKEKIWEIKGK